MAVDFGDAELLAALASRKAALDHGIEVLRNVARRDCQAEMAGAFAAFLSAHPCVLAVAWRQGTPGWRDGDECVFEVGFPRMFLSKALPGTPEPDDGSGSASSACGRFACSSACSAIGTSARNGCRSSSSAWGI